MTTLHISEQVKAYFTASAQPEIVEIAEASYVSLLGKGSPGTDVFYKKKKSLQKFVKELANKYPDTENMFTDPIVEIFYWYDESVVGFIDIGDFYTTVDLDLLQYRIAIRIPDHLSEGDIQQVTKISENPFARSFKRFTYTAGKCVQLLHVGPFAGELEILPVLQRFATENKLKKAGMHHEIHLVNFEKGQSQTHLQTILRDPVKNI